MNILLIHITIAISSIILLSLSVIKPSKTKIKAGYGLIAATLGSGTFLVVSTNSPLKSSCISGLSYIAVATVLTVAAHRKIVKQEI